MFFRQLWGAAIMLKKLVLFGGLAAGVVGAGVSARADDNGIAAMIHDLRREGGRVCQVDHWHYGSGTGPNKKAATADAVASWQSFTALEYGTDWARFQRAASRKVDCSNSGSGVSCSIEGRPCRG